jgi:hypothetical protein
VICTERGTGIENYFLDIVQIVHNKYNNQIHTHFLFDIHFTRRQRWAVSVEHMGERREACRVLVGKPEGKKPLERPRCR